MKFSSQEEYGLRCLVAIAVIGPAGSITIPELSKMEGLSTSHIAKLLSILRKSGYIKSVRGQLGGYSIAKLPANIPIREVLESLGGRLYGSGFCERHSGLLPTCVHEADCLMRPLWTRLQNAVDSVLQGLTLEDILESRLGETKKVHVQLNYQHGESEIPVR